MWPRLQVARNPENTVFDAKRLIGRKFQDPIVQADMKLWPFKVIAGPSDKPMIQVHYMGEDKKSGKSAYDCVLQSLEFFFRRSKQCRAHLLWGISSKVLAVTVR